jgi:DNA-binding transcriptional ArsR family regulator
MSTLHRDATDTEIEAHGKVSKRVERLRLEVLRALVAGEGSGSELSARTGIDILNVRPRLTELVDFGLAADTGIRRENERGNNERVIKATPLGVKRVLGEVNHENLPTV